MKAMTGKPGDDTGSKLKATDSYVAAKVATGTSKPVTGARPGVTEVAPEVSQGAWRERAFKPRAILSAEEIIKGLSDTLAEVMGSSNMPRIAFEEVRKAWLPFLRQAVEKAGGDGVDSWLLTALKPPGRMALDPLFGHICIAMTNMRASVNLAAFEEAAHDGIERIKKVLSFERPRKLSFKQMERELDGKLDVDELMLIALSDDLELERREREIAATMEALRDELTQHPGKQPDGIYANFVRLKTEFRVLEAEAARRESGLGNPSPRPSAPR